MGTRDWTKTQIAEIESWARLSDRQKFAQLALRHREDDKREALRCRGLSDEQRARILRSLLQVAEAAAGGRRPARRARSPRAQQQWRDWFEREKGSYRGGA